MIKTLSQSPNVYHRLIDSFAPHIQGHLSAQKVFFEVLNSLRLKLSTDSECITIDEFNNSMKQSVKVHKILNGLIKMSKSHNS